MAAGFRVCFSWRPPRAHELHNAAGVMPCGSTSYPFSHVIVMLNKNKKAYSRVSISPSLQFFFLLFFLLFWGAASRIPHACPNRVRSSDNYVGVGRCMGTLYMLIWRRLQLITSRFSFLLLRKRSQIAPLWHGRSMQ